MVSQEAKVSSIHINGSGKEADFFRCLRGMYVSWLLKNSLYRAA